jgi:hypothetical protein
MAESNLIEGQWAILKYWCKHVYDTLPGDSHNIADFLYEAAWRRVLN